MISCTEFVPAYSELFKFLDKTSGRQAVYDYWDWRFQPENSPLYVHLVKSGFRGAWEYWSKVITEEACDCTKIFNEKEGWSLSCMHSCPSRGRFCKLGYLEPFDEYCMHCNWYNIALKKKGFTMHRDHRGEEKACCRSLLTDDARFQGDAQEMLEKMYRCQLHGCTATTTGCPFASQDTELLHTESAQLRYFHPGFHLSMDAAAGYVLDHHGLAGLKAYLTQFTLAYHVPLLEKLRKDGLPALEEYFLWLYREEGAADALRLDRQDHRLHVSVAYCPAVRYMRQVRDHTPHAAYRYCTEFVYAALAEAAGLTFRMLSYEEETGAASWEFILP